MNIPGLPGLPTLPETPAQNRQVQGLPVVPQSYTAPEGFTVITPQTRTRLIVSVWGKWKSGKTHFSLMFPEPIYYLNIDMGLEGVVEKFLQAGKWISRANIPLDERTDSLSLRAVLDTFVQSYTVALEQADAHGGTVVVDTASQLWTVVRKVLVQDQVDARVAAARPRRNRSGQDSETLEEAQDRARQPRQLDYGEANLFMGGLLRKPYHFDKANAVFINRASEEYDNAGKRTGSVQYAGFGEMPAITQLHLQLTRSDDGGHVAIIEACRDNTSIERMVIPADYGKIKAMLGLT